MLSLPQGADIADRHGQDGQDQRELPGKFSRGRHGDDDQADDRRDAGDLWGDGEQAGVGAGRALIDIGSIELQRRDRQLET